jgi:hypothetical protein
MTLPFAKNYPQSATQNDIIPQITKYQAGFLRAGVMRRSRSGRCAALTKNLASATDYRDAEV